MIIKARFLDTDGNPKGREYTCGCEHTPAIGEDAYTPDGKALVVTQTGLPDEVGAEFGDKLKYLSLTPPEKSEPEPVEESVAEETPLALIPEITVNPLAVITVEQLPIIAEQLKPLSAEIDTIIAQVLALPCTGETKTSIKKHRASLNGIFKKIDDRRIAIKKQLDEPYDTFNAQFKALITDKINVALKQLDDRAGAIDAELKSGLLTDVKDYFAEYASCEGLDWLTFEQSGISVGLSDNKTALRRSAKTFIDRVIGDIAMIDTQDEKAEMHVEYRKTLNAALAIKTVKDRIAAVKQQEERQAQYEAERLEAQERRAAMDKIAAPTHSIALPVVEAPRPVITPEPEKLYSVAFKVTATKSVVETLSKYLKENQIDYKQIPLKNIMEVSEND